MEYPGHSNQRPPESYYDSFSAGGRTIQNLRESFPLLRTLKDSGIKAPLNSLLLGSAAASNIESVVSLISDAGLASAQNNILVIDTNITALNKHTFAKEKYTNDKNGTVHLAQMDARNLALARASVDFIISDFTFVFLPDKADIYQALVQCSLALKPGGVLFLHTMVYRPTALTNTLNRVLNRNPATEVRWSTSDHGVTYFIRSQEEYEKAIALAELALEDIQATNLESIINNLKGVKSVCMVLKKAAK